MGTESLATNHTCGFGMEYLAGYDVQGIPKVLRNKMTSNENPKFMNLESVNRLVDYLKSVLVYLETNEFKKFSTEESRISQLKNITARFKEAISIRHQLMKDETFNLYD